jgi:alkylation response protein AidB-like acyl-CoA dehydrogenase
MAESVILWTCVWSCRKWAAGLISPFFSTMVLGAGTILEAGSEEQKQQFLPAIAEGKSIVTLAFLEKNARYIPQTVQTQAVPLGDGFILNGNKLFVPDANSADYLIIAARKKTF